MGTKALLKEITESTIGPNGEMSTRIYREMKINDSYEPSYIKTYRGLVGGNFRTIRNVPIGFWAIVNDTMKGKNEIRADGYFIQETAEEMGVTCDTVKRWIKNLVDKNVLIRKFDKRGKPILTEYIVCPYISAIGKWKDIHEQQKGYPQCRPLIRYNQVPAIERKQLPTPSSQGRPLRIQPSPEFDKSTQ